MALHLLHDLAKDAVFTLMVYISLILEYLRLAPVDLAVAPLIVLDDFRQLCVNHTVYSE